MADDLKAKGNAAFSAGNYKDAIDFFTQAIALAPDNHVFYSNRSAAYASLKEFDTALVDANKVVELKPDWPKGYSRVGAAHHGLGNYAEAIKAYQDGLKHDPGNAQLQEGLQAARQEAQKSTAGGMFGPDFLAKLAMHPETRPFLSQPDFMAMIADLQTNPQAMGKYMQDPRFLKTLEVALGLRVASPGDEVSPAAEAPGSEGVQGGAQGGVNGHAGGAEEEGRGAAAQETAVPMEAEPTPPEPPKDLTPEEPAAAETHAAAMAAKEAGNAAYKAKDFEKALEHYGKALDLMFDVSFVTNRAAVYYEMGDYENCLKDCDEAIEKGRELRVDYKLVGRAYTRRGNALVKLNRLEEAVESYQKSLTEHRNADTLKRLNEAEKLLKDARENAYVDLAQSNMEKDAGNAAFKDGRYPEAVKHYTEALKRGPSKVNPEAYKLYSNRAACYTKLGALPEALKDADECITLNPSFVKGYTRKATAQFFMKEYEKALETYQQGLEHEPDNAECKEGAQRCYQQIARFASGDVSEEELKQRQQRAMQDPEIQNIMMDPIMQQVLKDFQENPSAAQQHLRNAAIRQKLNKLVAAGIVRLG